jgi:hypothetical protein
MKQRYFSLLACLLLALGYVLWLRCHSADAVERRVRSQLPLGSPRDTIDQYFAEREVPLSWDSDTGGTACFANEQRMPFLRTNVYFHLRINSAGRLMEIVVTKSSSELW